MRTLAKKPRAVAFSISIRAWNKATVQLLLQSVSALVLEVKLAPAKFITGLFVCALKLAVLQEREMPIIYADVRK